MYCFAVSSGAGLAALLWSKNPLSVRSVLASLTYSGMMGFIVGGLWMKEYGKEDPYFLLAVAGLLGLGRLTVTDLIAIAVKKSGVTFKIVKSEEEKP